MSSPSRFCIVQTAHPYLVTISVPGVEINKPSSWQVYQNKMILQRVDKEGQTLLLPGKRRNKTHQHVKKKEILKIKYIEYTANSYLTLSVLTCSWPYLLDSMVIIHFSFLLNECKTNIIFGVEQGVIDLPLHIKAQSQSLWVSIQWKQ